MRKDSLQRFQKRLETMKDELTVGREYVGDVGETGRDEADCAFLESASALANMDHRKRAETLRAVESALQRIKDGTYGECLRCVARGEPKRKSNIRVERLDAQPTTEYCLQCRIAIEKNGGIPDFGAEAFEEDTDDDEHDDDVDDHERKGAVRYDRVWGSEDDEGLF